MINSEKKYSLKDLERSMTSRQKKMCEQYLLTGCKSKAMRAAGYTARTVNSMATATFNRPKIKQYIEHLRSNDEKLVGVTRAMILHGHKQTLDFDLIELYDQEGKLKHPKDLPEAIRKNIASITTQPVKEGDQWTTKHTFKFKDGQKAAQEMSKLCGFYAAEKSQVTVETVLDFEGWTPEDIKQYGRIVQAVTKRKNAK